MLDPKEAKKGGFGAFAAKFRDQQEARAKADGSAEAKVIPPAPTVPPAAAAPKTAP